MASSTEARRILGRSCLLHGGEDYQSPCQCRGQGEDLRKERKRELRERKDDPESLFADEGED